MDREQRSLKQCDNQRCRKTFVQGTGNGNGYCCDPCEDQEKAVSNSAQKQAEKIGKSAKEVLTNAN